MDKQNKSIPAIWFPAVSTGTGIDLFTIRLVKALTRLSIQSDITWLSQRAEHAPWSATRPLSHLWQNIIYIISWLSQKYVPENQPLAVTFHGCVHDLLLAPYKKLIRKLYHRVWTWHCKVQNIAGTLRESLKCWRQMCAQATIHAKLRFAEMAIIDAWTGLHDEVFATGATTQQWIDESGE